MILGAAPGWAVLGEYENSIASDQQVMRGEVQRVAKQGYALHQITGTNGAVVKEYVSPSGRVFGVSWQGPFMPNLQQLLGSYFTDFQQAAQHRVRKRGPLVIKSDKVVIFSGGHMRSFRGIAYVPGLMPENVTAEVVR
jgi:Protein of unknown function (DUF2844)